MKIAIVHDELMRRGGAEQVVRCFIQAFPEAPVYTMAYKSSLTYPDFQNCQVKTSWFQKFAINERVMRRLFFPFGLLAMNQLEVSGYDIVLVSATYAGKYVKVSPGTVVITYCHTPFRLAWYPDSYEQYTSSKGLLRSIFNWVLKILRKIDFKAAQRTDYFIANTDEVRERIKEKYLWKKPIEVLQPPVNCNRFSTEAKPKDYFLVVSRLESYKKVDLVVEAFNELQYPLVIVGKGSMASKLKKLANSNIIFKDSLSGDELGKLYAECKAFIFPQKEDYGITPLEANASGRPVIAFGEGGVLDTMIPCKGNPAKATAIFFKEQTKDALKQAILQFESYSFDPEFIRKNAENFDETLFIEKIKYFVKDKYQTHFSDSQKEFPTDTESPKVKIV